MGFKDTEWAYSLDLPMREMTVLAALCLRTDDATHQTFVGQTTLAQMTGASVDTIQRALRALESAGVITRAKRHGSGGYRTSDLTTVNAATYTAASGPGEPVTYTATSGHLSRNQRPPKPQLAGAIKSQLSPSDHSGTKWGHTESSHYPAARETPAATPPLDRMTVKLAGQQGITDLAQVIAAVRGHAGRGIDGTEAYRLSLHLLGKAKTRPRHAQRYVLKAIAESWAEVQQFIDRGLVA